jgi:hypothetical protein
MFDDEISEWPDEVVDACRAFKQGNLIESPPVFFFGVPGYAICQITSGATPDQDGGTLVDLHPDDRPPFGLITTQTCDIDEQRKNPRLPFIHVCAVHQLPSEFDQGQLGHIEKDRVRHLMLLDSPPLPEGLWVVDFRLEAPIEKSALVGRKPIEAFRTVERYRLLAQRLALRVSRPAVANSVNDNVIASLRAWREGLTGAEVDRAWDPIHRVFLAVQGDLLDPAAVQVVVVTENEQLPSEGQELWNGWWDAARGATLEAGFNLVGNRFTTMRRLTAAEYLELVPLDMTYLAD